MELVFFQCFIDNEKESMRKGDIRNLRFYPTKKDLRLENNQTKSRGIPDTF